MKKVVLRITAVIAVVGLLIGFCFELDPALAIAIGLSLLFVAALIFAFYAFAKGVTVSQQQRFFPSKKMRRRLPSHW